MLRGAGNGPVDAFVRALRDRVGARRARAVTYHEHAIGTGEDATAVAYVQLRVGQCGIYGVGLDPNIVTATLKAIVAAVDRGCAQRHLTLRAQPGAAAA